MKVFETFEILAAVIAIALLFVSPLVFVVLILLLTGAVTGLARRKAHSPLKELYKGFETGVMLSTAVVGVLVITIIFAELDPLGIILIIPLSSLITIISTITGLVIGLHKQRKTSQK